MDAPAAPAVSRRKARETAMHIVFASISTKAAVAADCIAGLADLLGNKRHIVALDDKLVRTILRVYDFRRQDIEQFMEDSYGRPLDHMTMIERAIIAASVAEMMAEPETPYQVIIKEAVSIAETFGSQGGGALVNGILHNIAMQLRPQ